MLEVVQYGMGLGMEVWCGALSIAVVAILDNQIARDGILGHSECGEVA
jgi:hypothetical protein